MKNISFRNEKYSIVYNLSKDKQNENSEILTFLINVLYLAYEY